MSDPGLEEAYRLADEARRLEGDERVAFKYFVENLSVGVIRAVKDLKGKGVKDPQRVIARLVEAGLVEEGGECYNLAAPLRELVRRRGKRVLLA